MFLISLVIVMKNLEKCAFGVKIILFRHFLNVLSKRRNQLCYRSQRLQVSEFI